MPTHAPRVRLPHRTLGKLSNRPRMLSIDRLSAVVSNAATAKSTCQFSSISPSIEPSALLPILLHQSSSSIRPGLPWRPLFYVIFHVNLPLFYFSFILLISQPPLSHHLLHSFTAVLIQPLTSLHLLTLILPFSFQRCTFTPLYYLLSPNFSLKTGASNLMFFYNQCHFLLHIFSTCIVLNLLFYLYLISLKIKLNCNVKHGLIFI